MKRRKMSKKMNNKGFTLVELIVVLVILAILAAILVPTLMGYIEKAKSEKDFATAQSVRVAVQSMAAEIYAKDAPVTYAKFQANENAYIKKALKLVCGNESGSLDGQTISIESIEFDANSQITSITVGIKGTGDAAKKQLYEYTSAKNEWTAKTEN